MSSVGFCLVTLTCTGTWSTLICSMSTSALLEDHVGEWKLLKVRQGARAACKDGFGDVLFSRSPEHKVLMMSYCDQSMSVVRRQ